MTSVDSNGIVRYQSTDPVSPLHTLLNLGMQSVSDRVGPYTSDTGWVAVTPAAGFSSGMQVRRIGKVVYTMGLMTATTTHSLSSGVPLSIGTVPDGFRIASTEYLWPAQASVSIPVNGLLTPSGLLQVRTWGATFPGPVNAAYTLAGGWIAANA